MTTRTLLRVQIQCPEEHHAKHHAPLACASIRWEEKLALCGEMDNALSMKRKDCLLYVFTYLSNTLCFALLPIVLGTLCHQFALFRKMIDELAVDIPPLVELLG